MTMFFIFLAFICLWAGTEIVETVLSEKRRRTSHGQKKTLRWLD